MATLAQHARAKVNLIEFNPTPGLPFRPAPEERLEQFSGSCRGPGWLERCAAAGAGMLMRLAASWPFEPRILTVQPGSALCGGGSQAVEELRVAFESGKFFQQRFHGIDGAHGR